MKKETVRIPLRIPPDLDAAVRAAANVAYLSINQYVQTVLRAKLKRAARRSRP